MMAKIRLKILFLIVLVGFVIKPSLSISQSLDQVDTQINESQGVYQPMNLDYMGYSLGMTQKAWLDPLRNMGEGQTKPAYSRYVWTNGTIMPIRIRQSMITLINFPDWEYIQDAWVGDSGSFSAQQISHNQILVMPATGMPAGVDSNIVLIGRSGNKYVFYVRSEGINTERLTHLVVDIEVSDEDNPLQGSVQVAGSTPNSVSFGGAGGAKGGKNSQSDNKKGNWWSDVPVDPEKIKFDIEVYVINPTDVDIAPERVWRDDIFTYIDLGPKALNMLQRPVVNLIVQKSEVPVGFRTRGKYGRLIVVEAVGDMVLRNGAKIVCLKLRKDPAFGLDMVEYDNSAISAWDVPEPELSSLHKVAAAQDMANAQYVQNGMDLVRDSNVGPAFFVSREKTESMAIRNNISIEISSDTNVANLEKMWTSIEAQNKDLLQGYEPFYSVDTPADGSGKETFYLRIGPIKTLNEGDILCENLARRGISCNVVRTR
ncbi:MAG: TrbG/VirB9 family P-type conjugative transfer protein [Alphaproteobacteria bacterium]